jgi:hypothetical protein
MQRRASVWRLSALARAKPSVAASEPGTSSVGDTPEPADTAVDGRVNDAGARWRHVASGDALLYRALVEDAITARAQAPWGIYETLLMRLATTAARAAVSEALLRATVADADAKRRFENAHDFEWRHFEFFLFKATPDEQRAATRYAALEGARTAS